MAAELPPSRGPEPALTGVYLPRRSTWHLVGPARERSRGRAPTDWRLRLDPENVGIAEDWAARGLPGDTTVAEVPGI